ncbi:hypothetical protein [Halarchaeum nitratireducens]|uniref:Uncharacterized protein n=1 Tax=Halarchaeum nitratireducens TaxID=489913 RepID=A0A830G7G6_9EURY|nr:MULTISPECIES: hypothetical protein [Halarchaeum]MBP2250460.1 multidrug transporter EmrE-like cation transporter [Halarchaeum solikamskense]GGN08322.1 hypothetical protein GCM10009021_04660 [Halarchaeum nitratireducens]
MWIDVLPAVVIENLDVIALILLGLLVEKQYISRPAIWANVAAINIHLYDYSFVSNWLTWYANIGLLVAGLALYTYGFDESLPGWYYTLSWAYSSIPVAAIAYLTWSGAL